jgi:serine/threonine protein kinase
MGFEADMWALGCVLYEAVTGHFLFERDGRETFVGAAEHTVVDSLVEGVTRVCGEGSVLVELARGLLKCDKSDRLTSTDMCKLLEGEPRSS